MIVFNRKKMKNKWFEFDDDVSFLIKPFPLSERALSPSGTNIIEIIMKQAEYCLVDWKGIVDENNKPIKCNEENKRFILDFSDELATFICECSKTMNEGIINLPSKKI